MAAAVKNTAPTCKNTIQIRVYRPIFARSPIFAPKNLPGNILPFTRSYSIPNMALFKKSSKAYSIFYLKCPRCHEGEMFETGSWSMKKSFDMHKRCPKCNLNYFPEPGYYYGAMFISYIWTGWFCLFFIAFFHWFLEWSQTVAFTLLGIFLAVNFVYIFRISRMMWININVKYDKDAIKH